MKTGQTLDQIPARIQEEKPTSPRRRLGLKWTLPFLIATGLCGTVACVDAPEDNVASVTRHNAVKGDRGGSTGEEEEDECVPIPLPKNLEDLCDPQEYEEPSLPPIQGECNIEIRLKDIHAVSGQGISEGNMEVSTEYTLRSDFAGYIEVLPGWQIPLYNSTDAVVRVPESGEEIFYPGADHHKDKLLGEYIVQVGDTERIQVCAEFTEHDNGGPNGDDDVGTGCVEFVLSCDAVNGQPTEKENIGPVELCGPNQCNGSMSSKIQVMRADADGDCVENDDDFTPELCDEANKGSNGVALLQYFHFDDDALTTLVQTVGVTLQQSYNSYDFVVLLIDEESSNPFIIGPALAANGGALRKADLVFPPTRAGLMNAMQELTARGYRFDADIHAHGYKNGKTDSGFDTLNGGGISGTWLTKATEPDVIGTNRGGIPIVAWWSTTCWAERQLDAWQDIGAVAASGSKSINFFPNTYTNYLWGPWAPLGAGWLTGATYRNAVDNSLTFDVELVVSNFLYAQGATPPWNYPHSGICPGGILGQNNCAEDFFMTGTGNDAAYNIEDVYDITQSGWANVNIAYERSFVGNDSITFGYFPPGGWN